MLTSLLLTLLMSAHTPNIVEVRLGPVQREVVRAIRTPAARFLDVEGALRSAKTWTILIAKRMVLEQQPGRREFMARWIEGDLHQKLIPDWRNVCALMGISHGTWNAKERCFDLENGSRMYAVHLRTGQRDNRYATVRGLTVAGGYIDQLEEVPEDVYDEAALRLSQPGYRQQLVVSPNPIPETHWIGKRFPAANSKANHRYIRLAMRDNRHNLDLATIEAAEALYPIGHPLRRVKLEGQRGLDVRGTPVYLGAFVRSRHVRNLSILPDLPLCEAYDYGFHHPCVIWYQWAPWGWVRVLGGVMGSDLHLDSFLPIVERYRDLWFPQRLRIAATGDPAGANAHGVRGTPIQMLNDWYREHGERDDAGLPVSVMYDSVANQPERRVAANQRLATYMRRRVNGEEAFLVDPEHWVLAELQDEKFESFFVDGLEAGYVLEDEPRQSGKLGSFYVPKKDGWFDHAMNCLEYGAQAHILDLPLGDTRSEEAKIRHAQQLARDAATALRRQQQDLDDEDMPRGRRHVRTAGRSSRRGGY